MRALLNKTIVGATWTPGKGAPSNIYQVLPRNNAFGGVEVTFSGLK